jgi:hypothetical protein
MAPRDARSGCGFLDRREIEALLEDRLPDERRAEFVEHRATGCGPCVLLAADVETIRDVTVRGATNAEAAEFDAIKHRTLNRLHPRPASSSGTLWKAGMAAAAATVLIALMVFVIARPRSPQEIVVRLPHGGEIVVEPMPFSPPPVLRGSTPPDALWQRALLDYDGGRYRRAARSLRALEKRDPGSADASLYLGIAELLAGDTQRAREALARAREKARALDLSSAAACWYLALVEFLEGNASEGERLLSAAAAEGGPFGDRARRALD